MITVWKLVVEKSVGPGTTRWEPLYTVELEDREGELQMNLQTVRASEAAYLKVRFESGWSEYSTLHKISVIGKQLGAPSTAGRPAGPRSSIDYQ
jgi:hypothetical protein